LADLTRFLLGPAITRRQAKADAAGAVIRAQGETEADELRARAHARLELLNVNRQQRLEAVIGKTRALLPKRVTSEPVEPDWFAEFVNNCQDVSNDDMQTVWSKILTSELVKPGSFSKRTLNFVRLLSMEEARLFTRFCSFVWVVEGEKIALHFRPIPARVELPRLGLSFADLLRLEAIGLCHTPDDVVTIYWSWPVGAEVRLVFHGRVFRTKVAEGFKIITLPLTEVGSELLPICGAEPNEEYLNLCLESWKSEGFELTEVTGEGPTTASPR